MAKKQFRVHWVDRVTKYADVMAESPEDAVRMANEAEIDTNQIYESDAEFIEEPYCDEEE